jgi:hypothetical protein
VADGTGDALPDDTLPDAADEVATGAAVLSEGLLELLDEQPAAASPVAETHTATAMSERYRMECLRGRDRK